MVNHPLVCRPWCESAEQREQPGDESLPERSACDRCLDNCLLYPLWSGGDYLSCAITAAINSRSLSEVNISIGCLDRVDQEAMVVTELDLTLHCLMSTTTLPRTTTLMGTRLNRSR